MRTARPSPRNPTSANRNPLQWALEREQHSFTRSIERIENSLKTEQDPDARAKLEKRLEHLQQESNRIRKKMESYEELDKKSRGRQ